MPQEEPAKWYVLTFVNPASPFKGAQRFIDAFNLANRVNLQLFAPKYVVREQRNDQMVLRNIPLVFHYVFVRGVFSQIKLLCGQRQGFAFLLDRSGSERYAVIPDAQMEGFKTIARHYENSLPYFSLQDIDLEQGDLVEVVNGDFPGLIGRFMPNPKSKTGKVLLQVDHDFATGVFNIDVSDVRVLQFAKDSRRAYDQIDAFVPRLLAALRLYHQNQPLTKPLVANLTIFRQRMERVNLPDRKLAAKLSVLLAATNHLLGYPANFTPTPEVTNPWTLSLIDLISSIISSDPATFTQGHDRITNLAPTSKAQTLLLTEYSFHHQLF